jgi:hypothetical protein
MTDELPRYRQFVNSRAIYEVDVSHPVAVRPTWSLTHSRDGSPVAHGVAYVETSTDGLTGRLITHGWTGLVKVSVTVGVHPRTTATQGFEVEIVPVPDLSKPLSIEFSSHRDRPI